MDETLTSWVAVPDDSDFSIHNLPFGIFSVDGGKKKVGVAIGDKILDLSAVAALGYFEDLDIPNEVFSKSFLNDFISLGKPITTKVRLWIQELLSDRNSSGKDSRWKDSRRKDSLSKSSPLSQHSAALVPQSEANMHLPIRIGDYTDFYSSIEHATNVGKMFRDPENALLPNWKHIPVGYHGRASSIVVSGRPVHRPKGQVMYPDAKTPVFEASSKVDFELEMGFIIGKNTQLGESVATKDAEDYIFGKVLVNDWSARDIQKWEYVPLGPFLGKSFATSISLWVVTLEALEPFRVKGPNQDPPILPYLEYQGLKNYDINLQIGIKPEKGEESIVSRSNFKYMYWNMAQQIAHHTSNGCNLNVGDLMASGTISGKNPDSYGSMLELAWGGQKPVQLTNGEQRTFIEDHDTVSLRGFCKKEGIRVGFGEVSAKLMPATT